MSIAASENAGLGPCELSDLWTPSVSNTTTKSSTNIAEAESYCSKSSNFSNNFVPKSASTTNTIKTNTTITKTTSTSEFGSTNSNICNLPYLSPATATAAVTISNPTSTVFGLTPLIPASTGVVPLLPGEGSAATSPQIVNNNGNVTTESNNTNSLVPTTNALAKFSALQQSQTYFFNNNNSLLNNNNLLPLRLQYQHQYSSLHKAATTASNIAAALQRSTNMNAVASPISSNPSTSNRKVRRKNDSKANLPQSQINKCNNEKRRRELENNYIEQLSEFLQLNKRGDMASTKPDKAAILNQVVKTFSDGFVKTFR